MFYNFFVVLFKILVFIFPVKIEGRENLPKDGAVVAIANHRHWGDIVFLALALRPRMVHFMAKKEYAESKILDWMLYKLESFPVDRGEVDMKAIKLSMGYLRKKEVLGIFPEGTRNKGEGLLEFKEGAVMLAHKCNATIVPVGFTNASNIIAIGKSRPKIKIGAPIIIENPDCLTNKELITKYTEISQNAVADLIED